MVVLFDPYLPAKLGAFWSVNSRVVTGQTNPMKSPIIVSFLITLNNMIMIDILKFFETLSKFYASHLNDSHFKGAVLFSHIFTLYFQLRDGRPLFSQGALLFLMVCRKFLKN